MSVSPPVRYAADVETVRPDEAEPVGHLIETFDTILDTTSKDYGHAVRAVHAKAHGILAGDLTVDAGLPPELAQGLFAVPARTRPICGCPPMPATFCRM